DPHARAPPGGPAQRTTEGTPGGHLDHAVAAARALQPGDPPVMRQDGGPLLHLHGEGPHRLDGCRDRDGVNSAHQESVRNATITRAMGRLRATGRVAPARRASAASAVALRPRATDTTPSATVLG